jgi:predicted ester cyclase
MKKLLTIIPLVFLLCFAFSYQKAEEVAEEKAKVDLKKVADNIVKAYTSGDPVAIANLYAEDAVVIQPGEVIRGRKAIQESMESNFRAFPDGKIEFLTILPSGNHIVFEQVGSGTNTGPISTPEGEIPPTGKKVEFKAVWIGRISPEGLIEEDRTYYDTADFMRQLGLME